MLLDVGTHLIDQAVQLFGWPRRVYTEAEHRRPGLTGRRRHVCRTPVQRIRAHLWMSYVARLPGPAVRMHGLNGSYEKICRPAGARAEQRATTR